MKKIWKVYLIAAVIILLAFLAFVRVSFSSDKQKDRLDLWIDKLAIEESNNKSFIKHLDSNGYYSYGCLQFQKKTFISYVKHFNLLPYAEKEEIMNMIYDCNFQKSVAKMMILDDYENWYNWKNTAVNKIGLPPKTQ